MGRTVYLPTWMVDFDDFHVGKCTSPTDPMSFSQIWKFTIYRYLFFVQNSAFVSSFWCWKKQVDILSAMSKRIQTHDWMYLHILYFMQGSFWLGSIFHGWSTYPPLTYPPPRNKGLIFGLIKGNHWLISPDHKASNLSSIFLWENFVRGPFPDFFSKNNPGSQRKKHVFF